MRLFVQDLLHPTKLEHFVYVHSEMDEVQLADTILKYQSDWKLWKMIYYCFQKSFHTCLLSEGCNIRWEGVRAGFFKKTTATSALIILPLSSRVSQLCPSLMHQLQMVHFLCVKLHKMHYESPCCTSLKLFREGIFIAI